LNTFINADFLLQNQTALRLYHEVASGLPIVDFHNHLAIADLAANRQYDNLTRLWLSNDPYKHRLMRITGVAEKYITGTASDYEKFLAWAKTVPKTLGNPLFHWSALELKRIFDWDTCLSEDTADDLWHYANEQLQQPDYGALALVKKWNPEVLISSDDLLDDLSAHQAVNDQEPGFKILPSLRADSILEFDRTVHSHRQHWLEAHWGSPILSLADYECAVIQRLDDFDRAGCLLADHALDADFSFQPASPKDAATLFNRFLNGEVLSDQERNRLQSYLLQFLGQQYAQRDWVLQLHIGAQRHTSSRLRQLTGSTGGYASIGSGCNQAAICAFLDYLEQLDCLPKTILYAANPADVVAFSTMTGSFTHDGVGGKLQVGPPWWYNDHLDGICQHLITLSNYGLLSQFIGMTTDSRSILSLSRHEYFRRVLCNLLGTWVEQKILPPDQALLEKLVTDICYHNSRTYLGLTRITSIPSYEKSIAE